MDKKNICLALGFFDSVHLGHRKILDRVKDSAIKYNSSAYAMTFTNNIYGIIKQKSKLVYTYEERTEIFDSLGVKALPFDFTQEFGAMSDKEFLDSLLSKFNLKAVVCGKDFTFGKNKSGNVGFLEKFASEHNIELSIEDEVDYNGKRISTTIIKDMLAKHDIESANEVLGENYFINGIVVNGRGRGKTLGFPTANISIPEDKFLIGDGVYATDSIVDGKIYRSITNVGAKPTFSEDASTVETYLIDFDGNLYNKKIKIVFKRFMRDIIRFSGTDALAKQLEEDKNKRCLG